MVPGPMTFSERIKGVSDRTSSKGDVTSLDGFAIGAGGSGHGAAVAALETQAARPAVRIPAQNAISVALAAGLIGAWIAGHVYGVFLFEFSPDWETVLLVPALMAVQCWLSVGLFIIAHDAMHNTLIVGARRVNTVIGQACLGLYAGFPYHSMNIKHHDHHRFSGTGKDPDFNRDLSQTHGGEGQAALWPWYYGFFREYFGLKEFSILTAAILLYLLVLGAPLANMLVFWAVPALLSSLQLFYFGTYLPHRPEQIPFTDKHNARSNAYSWLLSLVTCFHFGYHLEHHRYPYLPWWRLPEARAGMPSREGGTP